jgi:phosphoribosylanthranilate isomerase
MTHGDAFPIKICGLSTPETLEAALAAGAEMIGLNFHPKSPRYVTPQRAAELADQARGRTQIVALVVDYTPEQAAELARIVRPDWIQLHGKETPHRVEAIRDEAGIAIMKAIGISTAEDVAHVADFVDIADRILLDAKAPKGADRTGGHGVPFDWSLLKALDPSLPFMLSGGLTPETVGEAIRAVRPMAVDVSSGVETAPGVKDAALIRAFIDKANSLPQRPRREGSLSAQFGGRFVAETLMPLILDLEQAYRAAKPIRPSGRDRAPRSTMSAARRRSISPSA